MDTLTAPTRPVTGISVINHHATDGGEYVPPEDVVPVYTVADRATNIDALSQNMESGATDYEVEVCGGDGTLSWVLAAATLAVAAGKDVRLRLKKKGGYKKDVAAMVAAAGGSIVLTPLLLERFDEGTQTYAPDRIVAYSFGLGPLAAGAEIANSETYRAYKQAKIARYRRWLPQCLAERAGNFKADLHMASVLMPEVTVNGERRPTEIEVNGQTISALFISNGQRVSGKWMRFRRQKLQDPGYMVNTVPSGTIHRIGGLAGRIVGWNPTRDVRKVGAVQSFSVPEGTRAMADGEDFVLGGGHYRMRELTGIAVTVTTEAEANKQ